MQSPLSFVCDPIKFVKYLGKAKRLLKACTIVFVFKYLNIIYNMKVAVLLTGQLRTFEMVKHLHMNALISKYNADVF